MTINKITVVKKMDRPINGGMISQQHYLVRKWLTVNCYIVLSGLNVQSIFLGVIERPGFIQHWCSSRSGKVRSTKHAKLEHTVSYVPL